MLLKWKQFSVEKLSHFCHDSVALVIYAIWTCEAILQFFFFHLGINQQIANGYVLAKQAIDSGKAEDLLDKWGRLTQELSPAKNS